MNKCDQRLPKYEIIRAKTDFGKIFQKGKRWKGKYLNIFYLQGEKRQIGFTVPKKLGNAVTRNRIKRLMREIYRKRRDRIGSYAIIMLAREGSGGAQLQDLANEFETFLMTVRIS